MPCYNTGGWTSRERAACHGAIQEGSLGSLYYIRKIPLSEVKAWTVDVSSPWLFPSSSNIFDTLPTFYGSTLPSRSFPFPWNAYADIEHVLVTGRKSGYKQLSGKRNKSGSLGGKIGLITALRG